MDTRARIMTASLCNARRNFSFTFLVSVFPLNLRRKLLFICFVNISGSLFFFFFLEVILGFVASFVFVSFRFGKSGNATQSNGDPSIFIRSSRRLVWLCSHAFFTLSDRLFIGLKKILYAYARWAPGKRALNLSCSPGYFILFSFSFSF